MKRCPRCDAKMVKRIYGTLKIWLCRECDYKMPRERQKGGIRENACEH